MQSGLTRCPDVHSATHEIGDATSTRRGRRRNGPIRTARQGGPEYRQKTHTGRPHRRGLERDRLQDDPARKTSHPANVPHCAVRSPRLVRKRPAASSPAGYAFSCRPPTVGVEHVTSLGRVNGKALPTACSVSMQLDPKGVLSMRRVGQLARRPSGHSSYPGRLNGDPASQDPWVMGRAVRGSRRCGDSPRRSFRCRRSG
jgi:hypothetical protein